MLLTIQTGMEATFTTCKAGLQPTGKTGVMPTRIAMVPPQELNKMINTWVTLLEITAGKAITCGMSLLEITAGKALLEITWVIL